MARSMLWRGSMFSKETRDSRPTSGGSTAGASPQMSRLSQPRTQTEGGGGERPGRDAAPRSTPVTPETVRSDPSAGAAARAVLTQAESASAGRAGRKFTDEQIRERAFAIYCKRCESGEDGNSDGDWARAEQELSGE